MIDCPPRRFFSTVFVKTSDAQLPPPGSCVNEDLNLDLVVKTGYVPDFTTDPNLGCTGKEWGADRRRGHRIGGRLSWAWRVELEVHGGECLDEL